MQSSIKEILQLRYDKAVVIGILGGEHIDPKGRPNLPKYGLEGIPIGALPLAPAQLRKLLEHHILSVDSLCAITVDELSKLCNFPSKYTERIVATLSQAGLSLGMSDSARESFSKQPASPKIREWYPSYRVLPAESRYSHSTASRRPYEPFRFYEKEAAERFSQRAERIFRAILKVDPLAARACSSRDQELSQPVIQMPPVLRAGREDYIYPVAVSRSMLATLATSMCRHPKLLEELIAAEQPQSAKKEPAITSDFDSQRLAWLVREGTRAAMQEARSGGR